MRVTPPDWLVKSTALLLKYIIDFRRRGYENRVILRGENSLQDLEVSTRWAANLASQFAYEGTFAIADCASCKVIFSPLWLKLALALGSCDLLD